MNLGVGLIICVQKQFRAAALEECVDRLPRYQIKLIVFPLFEHEYRHWVDPDDAYFQYCSERSFGALRRKKRELRLINRDMHE